MERISPGASIVQTHMYKSWIQANPELALGRVEDFYNQAKLLGMKLRYFEDDHYVDIVAALNESDLEKIA
jgi:hypothetical protein